MLRIFPLPRLRTILPTIVACILTANQLELTAFARNLNDSDGSTEVNAGPTATQTAPPQTNSIVTRVTRVSRFLPPRQNATPAASPAAPQTPPNEPGETPKKKGSTLKRVLIVAAVAGAGAAIIAAKRGGNTPAATITLGEPAIGQPQ